MSMLAITEAVYNALSQMGLPVEHECFDDLMIICVNVAAGRDGSVDEAIFAHDTERGGVQVTWDIVSFIAGCELRWSAVEVVAQAIAAGKRAAGRVQTSAD